MVLDSGVIVCLEIALGGISNIFSEVVEFVEILCILFRVYKHDYKDIIIVNFNWHTMLKVQFMDNLT